MQKHHHKQIEIGTTDSERYELLKDKTIEMPFVDTEKLEQINPEDYDSLERIGKSGAFKILRKIGEEFGVFKEGYTTQDVDVEFGFSRRNLQESVNKQRGKFKNYVKMITILNEVVNSAICIEVQKDRYNNPDSQLDSVFILISSFIKNSYIIPVLMEVKIYTNETTSSLYIAVSLNEIERSRILGHIPDKGNVKPCPSPTSITVSLSDILSNVNTADTNLLKYIPDGFLDKTQKEAKQKALKEMEEYIDKKNRQRMAKADKISYGDGFISEPFIGYHSDEYDIAFIYRRVS